MRMDWMNGIGECDMLLYITFFVGSMCRSVLACGFLGTYSSCALPWKSILSFPSGGFDLIFPSFTWRTLYKTSHHYHRIATSLCIALSPIPSTHNTHPQHPINTMFSSPKSFKSSSRSKKHTSALYDGRMSFSSDTSTLLSVDLPISGAHAKTLPKYDDALVEMIDEEDQAWGPPPTTAFKWALPKFSSRRSSSRS
ncbi:hypothetical protein BJ912DRAFT_258720 [Pholiota molesta]|nr:hypothetical protein BJ912DRAFT_258720 [Pholiota molesta]